MPRYSSPAADRARANRILAQVKRGLVVFRRDRREWEIVGPADLVAVGQPVLATRADGTTSTVYPTEIMSVSTVAGEPVHVARFAATAPGAAQPVRDSRDTGRFGWCLTCGEGLDRNRECAECG